MVPVIAEYIAVKAGLCGGKPHIVGHRVKVQHVAVWHERMGMSPEEIVATYPSLSLPAVYAALAFPAHRPQIDADIEADDRFVAEMKAQAGPSSSATSWPSVWQGRSASTWMKLRPAESPRG